jgi:hypothetical protein
MDPTKLTRAQAERLAARTEDEEVLRQLARHKNKHVVAKAVRKLAKGGGAP